MNHFVNDGRARAIRGIDDANRQAIEQTVEAEYAEDLVGAGPLRRWTVRRKIRYEVKKRLAEIAKEKAPIEGLY